MAQKETYTIDLDGSGRFDVFETLEDWPGYQVHLGLFHEYNGDWGQPYDALLIVDNEVPHAFPVYDNKVKVLDGTEVIDLLDDGAFIATHLIVDEGASVTYIGKHQTYDEDGEVETEKWAQLEVILDELLEDICPEWAEESGNTISADIANHWFESSLS